MKLITSIIISLLIASTAFAMDSIKIAEKLINLLNQDLEVEYILAYKNPRYVDSYNNADGTKIHLFKAVITFPVFGESNDFNLGGNQEVYQRPTGEETKCEYIKFDEVENDFTYGGDCKLRLEDVTNGALFDENLIDEN